MKVTLMRTYTHTEYYDMDIDQKDFEQWCDKNEMDPQDSNTLEAYALDKSYDMDPTDDDWDVVNETLEVIE